MQQLSDEWFLARKGKLTASRVGEIMPGKRGAYLKARDDLLSELVNQRLGVREEPRGMHFAQKAMDWGTKWEPVARQAYELKTGDLCEELGLIDHPTLEGMAASPDGKLILKDTLIEIKCPFSDKQDALIDLLIDEVPVTEPIWLERIDSGYQWQMLCQMACTGAEEMDFVQYDSRVEEAFKCIVIPFPRDEERIDQMLEEASKFLNEVTTKVTKRRSKSDRIY